MVLQIVPLKADELSSVPAAIPADRVIWQGPRAMEETDVLLSVRIQGVEKDAHGTIALQARKPTGRITTIPFYQDLDLNRLPAVELKAIDVLTLPSEVVSRALANEYARQLAETASVTIRLDGGKCSVELHLGDIVFLANPTTTTFADLLAA